MFHQPVKFTLSNVAALKKALRTRYANIRSSHADEAVAASFGFKTYAAMLVVLHQVNTSARLVIQTDACLLILRLEQLGYSGLSPRALRRMVWEVPYPDPWHEDELERSLRGRFAPIAANSQPDDVM